MDYNLIWYILIAVLFIGYIVLDGFDLGVGMHVIEGESDKHRRKMINSIGPVWNGNEVWLITAGGALFAAFPHVYASIFSGYYTALMLFLLVMIIRGVSIEFRSKVETEKWRNLWDTLFSVSSYLIVLLLGVAFANVAAGLPLDAEMEYHGGLLPLLNIYAIVFGLMAISGIRLHGYLYLLIKTEGELQEKIKSNIKRCWLGFPFLLIAVMIYTYTVQTHLFTNYQNYPVLYLIPVLALVFLVAAYMMNKKNSHRNAFIMFSLVIVFTLLTFIAGMFPNFVISNPNFAHSLNAYNSASSTGTLSTMFIIALIGVPLILIYQIIIYRLFKGKVKLDEHSY